MLLIEKLKANRIELSKVKEQLKKKEQKVESVKSKRADIFLEIHQYLFDLGFYDYVDLPKDELKTLGRDRLKKYYCGEGDYYEQLMKFDGTHVKIGFGGTWDFPSEKTWTTVSRAELEDGELLIENMKAKKQKREDKKYQKELIQWEKSKPTK